MNPIARLEELRAIRKRFLTVTPANCPNSPNCLATNRARSPADNWDNRDNRVTENPNKGRELGQLGQLGGVKLERTATPPIGRQLGELGESGEQLPKVTLRPGNAGDCPPLWRSRP